MQVWQEFKYWFLHYKTIGDIDVWRVFAAAGAFLLVYLFRRVIVRLLLAWGGAVASRTRTSWDDRILAVLKPPLAGALMVANVWVATFILSLPEKPWDVRGTVDGILLTAFVLIGAWAGIRASSLFTVALRELTARTESKLDDRLVPFLEKFLRIVVIIIAGLMLLQQAGLRISGLLAGLGLGGLAIALAAKDMLANIFASVTILGDDAFQVGDWIKTSDVEGIVEDIGFRSTKIRTFANTLITISNARLVSGGLENFSRMQKRRLSFTIGVTYETTTAQMREAVERLRDILREDEGIRQDFWIVNFTEFADSSMNIFVYCFTHTTVWAEFLAVRQELNLKIMAALDDIGVEFAFPSHAIYQRNDDPKERQLMHDRAAKLLAERAKQGEPEDEQTLRPGSSSDSAGQSSGG